MHIMRKALIISVLLSFLLAASSSTIINAQYKSSEYPLTLEITEADNGRTVDGLAGQILNLSLPSQPSTGFQWEFDQLDPLFLQQIKRQFRSQESVIGSQGIEEFQFRIQAEGTTILRLVYRRPWESKKEPLQKFFIKLNLRGFLHDPLPIESVSPGFTGPQTRSERNSNHLTDQSSFSTLPASFDWRVLGGVTPIKDQGSCGSCWAFATTGAAESALKIWGGIEADLSEQYLIGHNEMGMGCNGGLTAFDLLIDQIPFGEREPGVVLETECPYTSTNDLCQGFQPLHHPYVFNGKKSIPNHIEEIKEAIRNDGPVVTGVCAGPEFSSYKGGIFDVDETSYCCNKYDHDVVLVGWDDSQGANGVWIARNSWGGNWGENGYMRIGYGMSGIGENASQLVYSGPHLETISQTGGGVKAVFIQEPYVYLGLGNRLAILDITDPTRPVVVGLSQPMPVTPWSIFVQQPYAYVTGGRMGGLRIFDVSDPAHPHQVGIFNSRAADNVSYDLDVQVAGSYAYLVHQEGLHVLNINIPGHIEVVGSLSAPGARVLTLAGNYAYLAINQIGLMVVDIQQPDSPKLVTTLPLAGNFYDVDFQGGFVFISNTSGKLHIIDVSDPSHPIETATFEEDLDGNHPYFLGVAASGTKVYTSLGWLGLGIIDISNPAHPYWAGSISYSPYQSGHSAWGLAESEGKVYLADSGGGLRIIDVTEPTHPTQRGYYNRFGAITDLSVSGHYLYVSDHQEGIQIVDIADASNPTIVGEYKTPGNNVQALVSVGSTLYLGLSNVDDGLTFRIIDISKPLTPREVGAVHAGGVYGLSVNGNYAYVADSSRGLRILDLSNPASPSLVSNFQLKGSARRVKTNGNTAYVLADPRWNGTDYTDGGLFVFDITNKEFPQLISTYSTENSPTDIVIQPPYAYLAAGDGSIHILNVADPKSISKAGVLAGSAHRMNILDNYLVLGADSLSLYDITSPVHPVFSGSTKLPYTPIGLAANRGIVWTGVSGGGEDQGGLFGIQVLRNTFTGYVSGEGGALGSEVEGAILDFEKDSLNQESAINIRWTWLDPFISGWTGTGQTFSLNAVAHHSGQPVTLMKPFSLKVPFSRASEEDRSVALFSWNGNQWVKEPAVNVDANNLWLEATLDHFGLFTILQESESVFLPLVIRP